MARKVPPSAGPPLVTAEMRRRREQREAITRWAKRKLEAMSNKPAQQPVTTASKSKRFKGGKKPKAKGGGRAVQDQAKIDAIIPRETQQHGDFRFVPHKLQEVTEGGKRIEKVDKVLRNCGATTVDRWYRAGRLTDRQVAAIEVYVRNYHMHLGMPPRVVANWGAVIVGMVNNAMQNFENARYDAKRMLMLFDQDINFRRGMGEWAVWQRVVLDDEPAGVAGSRLGFKSKQAQAAALVIVQSIADAIAMLVIDQNPPDLEQLLFDIDAPRKPRKIA